MADGKPAASPPDDAMLKHMTPRRKGMLNMLTAKSRGRFLLTPVDVALFGRDVTVINNGAEQKGYLLEAVACPPPSKSLAPAAFVLTFLSSNVREKQLRREIVFVCSSSEQLVWLRACSTALNLAPLLDRIVDPASLTLGAILGAGAFGVVYAGTLRTLM